MLVSGGRGAMVLYEIVLVTVVLPAIVCECL